MAKARRTASETVSLSAARRLERTGKRFTAAWRAGAPLRIEDLLAKAADDERPALFAELLRLERELRGPTCAPEEYRARFPDYAAEIDTVFAATVALRPT